MEGNVRKVASQKELFFHTQHELYFVIIATSYTERCSSQTCQICFKQTVCVMY